MATLRKTQTTDFEGHEFGSLFNDGNIIPNINTAVITRIILTADSCHLRSITVQYAGFEAPTHGESANRQTELSLAPGEYIATVEGYLYSSVISKITFVTNKGRLLEAVGLLEFTSSFKWGPFEPGMGLLYFGGKADTHIRMLKATFGMYGDKPDHPRSIVYEKNGSTAPAQLSRFAQNLMSPPVTLLVGADRILFHTSQHVLCRLPFFRAALQGQFREASEQSLTMPEDEPQNIAAMIEFLYTSNYTYQYGTDGGTDGDPDIGCPAPALAEGLYHVGVYATAHKYDCDSLAKAALENFVYVLRHLKGVEVMRLWKAAYAENLQLENIEGHGKLEKFKRDLPKWLKELYTEQRAAVEAMAVEYPLFMSDLLRLLVM